MLLIIITSAITSFIVSFVFGKWSMHNLTKWMEGFFKQEQEFIKKNFDEFVDIVKKERR